MTSVLPPIAVPLLSGGRDRARALLETVPADLGGAIVVVDFRRTVAGTPSFADEIVVNVLVNGRAQQLRAEHVNGEVGEYLLRAAKDHGVSERLSIT